LELYASRILVTKTFKVFLGSLGTFISASGGILIADYFLYDKEEIQGTSDYTKI